MSHANFNSLIETIQQIFGSLTQKLISDSSGNKILPLKSCIEQELRTEGAV